MMYLLLFRTCALFCASPRGVLSATTGLRTLLFGPCLNR